jgi:uncharacterized membrane protein YfcA
MSLLDSVLLFFAAAIAGVINSIAGGGTFIAFPALLFTNVAAIPSNAICSVALWPGSVASIGGYRLELISEKKVLPYMVLIRLLVGSIGEFVMLKTPENTFMELVPYLLLIANIIFIFGKKLTSLFQKGHNDPKKNYLVVSTIFLQLFISFYGGFFGAGMGILMLAALTLMGMTNIHKMNAFKVVLGSAINGTAAFIFIFSGIILWPQTAVMIVGAVLGGYGGAHYARRVDPQKVRMVVILIGCIMTIYFFLKVYLFH